MNTVMSSDTDNSLSTKITMIVFWGLFIVGLGFAGLLLHNIEENIVERREASADSIAYRIYSKHLKNGLLLSSFKDELMSISASLNIIKIDILKHNELITHIKNNPLIENTETLSRLIQNTSDNKSPYKLVVTFTGLEETIHNERKQLLIILGTLLLIFGIILKLLLERILNKPMTDMVIAAKAISSGDVKQTFNEQRKDEFGYLARFINAAVKNMYNQEQEAYKAKEFAEVTLRSIGDGIVTTDEHGNITFMNPVAEKLSGHLLDDVGGKPLIEIMPLICEVSNNILPHPIHTCLEKNEIIDVETDCVLLHKDGTHIPVTNTAAPIQDNNRQLLGGIMVFHDVSEARSLQQELSYQASHDHLTGLYNRREFDQELKLALLHAKRDNHEHALCYLDLDQFKVVNDTCGHAAGDMLLQKLSEQLKSGLRKSDVLARLGGDEFALLLLHCDIQKAEKIAENIHKQINEFVFEWEGKICQIGVSIGLTSLSSEFQDANEILAATDIACYTAKEEGRNRIHVYQANDMKLKKRREEMNMVTQVRESLSKNSFELFAQPIVSSQDVRDCKHYEILIRLKGEGGEYISPIKFIPAAEKYQLMADIDRWVIHNSFQLIIDLSKHKKTDFSLAINLSGQSINDTKSLQFIVDKIAEFQVDASRICFEITETAAINNLDQAIHFIETLKKHNCKFALDDFGTGVSSFEYLKRLPVDFLKIDGAFIKQMDGNKIDRAMVKAINEVAVVMGMKTIAEFVENEAIYKILNDIGINYAQGYWVSKPELASKIIQEY